MNTANKDKTYQEAMMKLGRMHAREVLAQQEPEEQLKEMPSARKKDLQAFKQGQEASKKALGR